MGEQGWPNEGRQAAGSGQRSRGRRGGGGAQVTWPAGCQASHQAPTCFVYSRHYGSFETRYPARSSGWVTPFRSGGLRRPCASFFAHSLRWAARPRTEPSPGACPLTTPRVLQAISSRPVHPSSQISRGVIVGDMLPPPKKAPATHCAHTLPLCAVAIAPLPSPPTVPSTPIPGALASKRPKFGAPHGLKPWHG